MAQKTKNYLHAICLLLVIIMLSGCSPTSNNEAMKEDSTIGDPDASSWENVHNLSADGSVKITDSIGNEEVFFVSKSVYTNSHKVSITNNSGVDITVYLYSSDDLSDPIRRMAVSDGERDSFTGLTSRFAYNIGIETTASTSLNITIAD